jgi:PAS domain S-box-containing protein
MRIIDGAERDTDEPGRDEWRPVRQLRTQLGTWPPLLLTAMVLGIAAGLRLALDSVGSDRFPFVAFFPAVLVCAIVAGWRYGLFTLVASAALVIVLDRGPFDVGFAAGLVVFAFGNLIMIAVAESARRARFRAEAEATSAHESERRFRAMADHVPLMIWVHDPAGRLQFVNRAWEAFFGATQEQARRKGWEMVVHPEDAGPYSESFRDSLRRKAPFDGTARVMRADGEWRWIESHGVPRVGPRGELISFAGTSLDVTDRRALELEREVLLESERAARSDAETATRAKDEFLATLSHELRTPLSVIVLWSRILARKYGNAGEDLRKGLALIIDNGMALSQLIGDLLDMSRIVAGRITLDLRPVDAAELVGQAVTSHRPAVEGKHITLSCDIGPDAKVVLGDPTRLQQVLWNLLANAVKFTPEHGHIWVAARREGDGVEITVRDDGEGIAPEFLSQIFTRFRQADSTSARRHGGLGLGLAIVKQLVELHGGTVRASSRGVGFGSTFTVTLPLHASAVAPDIDSSGTWRRLDPDRMFAARLDGLRVLAVEDQVDMLDSLRQMLEDHGAIVTPVASGAAAFALLRTNPGEFDALVSDIGMPQMDGYDLIRRIRADLGLGPHRLPAVAVTAYARDEDRRRALHAGFQSHVTKPYQANQLVTILNQLRSAATVVGSVRVPDERGTSLAS